jgi:SNF2 family DNA or RNA helicase
MKAKLHNYQSWCVEWLKKTPKAGLLLDMGLGKTLITLTTILDLHLLSEVNRVLVVATKRVAQDTWTQEIAKWNHLKHLTYSVALGTPKQRQKALEANSDIVITSHDNICWLVDTYYQGCALPFDMLVIDECSFYKNPNSKRFKAMRHVVLDMERLVLLTGTPAPNSLADLWSQIYLLDQGARLEKYIGRYRQIYFSPGARSGHIVYAWSLKNGAQEAIYKKIGDVVVSMKASDYLELPPRVENTVEVTLSPKELSNYKSFEREKVLELETADVEAVNAAVLTGKLMQYANGAIYDEAHKTLEIHNKKVAAIKEIVEEAQGEPVLIFYQYKHDLERLQKALPLAQTLDSQTAVRWNKGEVPILLAHPKSSGHGLNLQYGGHIIVWFALTWSLEQYNQANARLDRQGQTKPVVIHHLVAKGTVDERVLRVLQGKEERQSALLSALKASIAAVKNETSSSIIDTKEEICK